MRDLDDLGVVAFMGRLTSNIGPPSEHRVENADHADTENIWCRREHVMHPGDAPDCRHECGNRTERRPRARLDQVIIVLWLGVSVGHLGSLRLSVGHEGPWRSYSYYFSFVRAQAPPRYPPVAPRAAAPDTWYRTA